MLTRGCARLVSRLLIVAALALLLPCSTWAAGAVVQHQHSRDSATTSPLTVPFDSSVTAGNTIIVMGAVFESQLTSGTITDTQSNTYTIRCRGRAETGSDLFNVAIWTATVGSTGALSTSMTTSNSAYHAMVIVEASGLDNADLLEVCVGAGPTTSANATAGNLSPVTSGLAFGIMTHADAASIALGVGAGYTLLREDEDSSLVPYNAEYRAVTGGAGPYAADWTQSSVEWIAVAVSLNEGGGGPPPSTPSRLLTLGVGAGQAEP